MIYFIYLKSWVLRDPMGVSLVDNCTFDIRDNLISERQMSKLKNDDYTGGADPCQRGRS